MEKPSTEEGPTAAAATTLVPVAGPSKSVTLPNSACDELPYPPEKYPGKLCALCNLGERSQLGQGTILKIPVTSDEPMDVPREPQSSENPVEANSSFEDSDSTVVLSHKRQKNGNKLK